MQSARGASISRGRSSPNAPVPLRRARVPQRCADVSHTRHETAPARLVALPAGRLGLPRPPGRCRLCLFRRGWAPIGNNRLHLRGRHERTISLK